MVASGHSVWVVVAVETRDFGRGPARGSAPSREVGGDRAGPVSGPAQRFGGSGDALRREHRKGACSRAFGSGVCECRSRSPTGTLAIDIVFVGRIWDASAKTAQSAESQKSCKTTLCPHGQFPQIAQKAGMVRKGSPVRVRKRALVRMPRRRADSAAALGGCELRAWLGRGGAWGRRRPLLTCARASEIAVSAGSRSWPRMSAMTCA
jgi:hypothetical protein